MSIENKIIVILGPTSSGKTRWAVRLTEKLNGEIISADSRQIYRGMDIGTGKDLDEYQLLSKEGNKVKEKKIKYHLIDVVSPKKRFTVFDWKEKAEKVIQDIFKRKKVPIITGGTGMYISALTDGYVLPKVDYNKKLRKGLENLDIKILKERYQKLDPKGYKKIDLNNPRRLQRAIEVSLSTNKPFSELQQKSPPPYQFLIFGIKVDRQILNQYIDKRLEERLNEGLVEEVKKLHKQGISWKRLDGFGLEYRFVSKYLQNEMEYYEMVKKLKIAIHQFAKRQMTWFKRDKKIIWVKNYSQILKEIKRTRR